MPETARPPLRRVAVLIPTYNERDTLPVIVRRLREVVPDVDVVVLDDNSPGRHRRGRRRPRRRRRHRCTSSTGPARRGWAPPTSPGFRWALDAGLRRRRRDGRRRLAPPRAPARPPRRGRATRTPSSARAGCAAGRSSTGRCTARRSRWAATSTSRCSSGCRSTTPPRATGSTVPTRCAPWVCDDVASQGYCFQTDLTWRAVKAGPDRRRGADHLRRARGRRLEDEPRHHDRVAAAHHRLGRAAPRPPGPRARRRRARAEVALAVSRDRRHPVRVPQAASRGCCAGSSSPCSSCPIVEIAAIIAVGRVIGGWQTLAPAASWSPLLGAWIVKREGSRTWAGPAGGAAQRSDAEPSARRRRPRAHRRHAAADAGLRHRHRRLLLHPAADPPAHPGVARGRRRPPPARADGGVAGGRWAARRRGPPGMPGTRRRRRAGRRTGRHPGRGRRPRRRETPE